MDSRSECSILNRPLASQKIKSSPHAVWIHEKVSPQLRTFSNEPIQIEGKIQTPITSNGWTSNSAIFNIVADGIKFLIGKDLFDHLGLAVTRPSSSQVNQVNNISSSSQLKKHIAKNFPNLIAPLGKSKNFAAKFNFYKDFQPRLQKCRRIPINLQDKVNNELKNLLDEKHIKNFLVALTSILYFPL